MGTKSTLSKNFVDLNYYINGTIYPAEYQNYKDRHLFCSNVEFILDRTALRSYSVICKLQINIQHICERKYWSDRYPYQTCSINEINDVQILKDNNNDYIYVEKNVSISKNTLFNMKILIARTKTYGKIPVLYDGFFFFKIKNTFFGFLLFYLGFRKI